MSLARAIEEEFDPIPRSKEPRIAQNYQKEVQELAPSLLERAAQAVFDLNIRIPHPRPLLADTVWAELSQLAKDEFRRSLLHIFIGETEIHAAMTDVRAARLLEALPAGELILRIKFMCKLDPLTWVIEDKFDPVKPERKKGQGVVVLTKDTRPGVLVGIDKVYYGNAYPKTLVVYGAYPTREPDPANLASLRVGPLNCVAQRVVEHFEGAAREQGMTPERKRRIQEWEGPRTGRHGRRRSVP